MELPLGDGKTPEFPDLESLQVCNVFWLPKFLCNLS